MKREMTRSELVSALEAHGVNKATLKTATHEWLRSCLFWLEENKCRFKSCGMDD